MTIEHIVRDWNGTLLADGPALIEATIEAFRECGLPAVTRESYQRHHVQPIPLFYARLAGRDLTGPEQTRLAVCFRAAYDQRRTAVTLTADALPALSSWAAAGGRQSLLSTVGDPGGRQNRSKVRFGRPGTVPAADVRPRPRTQALRHVNGVCGPGSRTDEEVRANPRPDGL